MRRTQPFFWIVTVTLLGMYAWSLTDNPALAIPSRLIPYSLLMAVHLILHWASMNITLNKKWAVPYLVVQGALAFTLVVISQKVNLSIGLYMALIGEAVGILRYKRYSTIAVLVYLMLSSVNFILLAGWSSLGSWLIAMVPVTVFVVIYVSLFTREMEARSHAQTLLEELKIAHQQLADYADTIEELTLTAERQRMARELHDTLAQGLAGLILQLEAADAHISSSRPERAQAIIRQAMSRARDTLSDARKVIDDLRSGPNDLEAAIRQEASRFSSASGIPCTLEISLRGDLPEQLCQQTLRVVNEGLINIDRHARATQAWLHLSKDEQGLHIEIGDNGTGFDLDHCLNQAGHYGLKGIEERARLAGGSLEIATNPGEGTKLILRLPVRQGEEVA
ncbi:MAG: sensor histidine kinase [Anaerolineaceae bacterium]|nr:sensor histidine kinase [Anaerolineaceae bacterium]